MTLTRSVAQEAAGQFIMSGSFTTAAFVRAGDDAGTTISGLGAVSVRLT